MEEPMTLSLSPLLKTFFFILVVLPFLIHSRTLNHTNQQSFMSFLNLEGIRKGQTAKGLNKVRLYLNTFGYLNNNITSDNDNNYFDETLESAVKLYQNFQSLKVTGKLDSETIKLMNSPRCGVPDNKFHTHSSNFLNFSSHYAFFDGQPKWPPEKFHLRYTFNSSAQPNIAMEDYRAACSQAFGEWTKNSQFTFEEVAQGSPADVVIGFHDGDHGDGSPFDGPYNILAHAFEPTAGRLHFDGEENWSFPPPGKDQIDVIWVAMHEMGHVLGLQHSSDPNAVMYAIVNIGQSRRALYQDDIAAIQALYK